LRPSGGRGARWAGGEKLDIKPVEFFVRRVVRPTYACRQCETVVTAPILPKGIARGIAAPDLPAHVSAARRGAIEGKGHAPPRLRWP
jgi:transposase